jgi:hypothetical protein
MEKELSVLKKIYLKYHLFYNIYPRNVRTIYDPHRKSIQIFGGWGTKHLSNCAIVDDLFLLYRLLYGNIIIYSHQYTWLIERVFGWKCKIDDNTIPDPESLLSDTFPSVFPL